MKQLNIVKERQRSMKKEQVIKDTIILYKNELK